MQPGANHIVYTSYSLNPEALQHLYQAFLASNITFGFVVHILFILWTVYSIFAFIVSAVFVYGIIYAYIREGQLSEIQSEALAEQEKMWHELHTGNIENERWLDVQKHLSSDNPNDWKLAIIEADVLLERLLDKAGFAGASIGEKLKSASSRSFETIDDAWQAHRIRNQIAHGGTDFVLTHRMAKDALIMYERVFKEFDMI